MIVTSKTKFAVSKTGTPSKAVHHYVTVTAKGLNLRAWAGAKYSPCSFSPLAKGDIMAACDAILSDDGKTWFYVRVKGKYGFCNAAYTEAIAGRAVDFMTLLDSYNSFIKAHGSNFSRDAEGQKTFAKAKAEVNAGRITGISCVLPLQWALTDMGINHPSFYVKNGVFMGMTSDVAKVMKRDKKAIGLTVKQAVDQDLLKAGDVIGYKDYTHTFAYSGKDYLCYDAGGLAQAQGYSKGILLDYSKQTRKISEVIRWV